jgi:protein required for attachment to host cells
MPEPRRKGKQITLFDYAGVKPQWGTTLMRVGEIKEEKIPTEKLEQERSDKWMKEAEESFDSLKAAEQEKLKHVPF